jgi:aryl-alcohol dehydrogenase-like predicted oxidoreductase
MGYGAMPLSIRGRPAREQAKAVLERVLELGVSFIDTADSYCLDEGDKHHSERLLQEFLSEHPRGSEIKVATKGGLMRPEGRWERNADPKHLERTIRESFAALGGKDPIFLWQLHAPDPQFPIEVSLEPVAQAVDQGLIAHVGLSNVNVEEIERAQQVVPIVSIQNKYNPWHRAPEQDGVLAYCEEHQLTFLPWSPLGGSSQVSQLSHLPLLAEMAQELDLSPARLWLAYLMARSSCLIPIPGARRLEHLEDSFRANEVSLTEEQVQSLDGLQA